MGQALPAHGLQSRVFDHHSGFASNSVTDMAFSDRGLLWVTTHDGLYRIASHKVRRIDRFNDTVLLPDFTLVRVSTLPNNLVLISSEHDLFLLDERQNRVSLIGRDSYTDYQRGGATAITEAEGATFWVLNELGQLYRFDMDRQQATLLSVIGAQKHFFQRMVHHRDTLVTGTRNQLIRFSMDGEVLLSQEWPKERGNLTTLFSDRQGRLWVASTRGLYYQQGEHFVRIDAIGRSVRDIKQDSNGNLWVVTTMGLFRLGGEDLQVTALGRSEDLFDLAASMHKLELDGQDNLWVATISAGIAALSQPEDYVVDRLSTHTSPALGADVVWGFGGDAEQLFVAHDQGLDEVSLVQRTVRPMILEGLDPLDAVFNVLPISDTELLAGSSKGLFLVDRATGMGRRIATGDDGLPDLSNRVILSLAQGPGRVWLATDIGLYLYHTDSRSLEVILDEGERLSEVRNVLDLGDEVWLGGRQLFGRYHLAERRFESTLNWLPAGPEYHFGPMTRVAENRLLVGSFGEGVLEVNTKLKMAFAMNEQWRLNCITPYFIEATSEGAVIGCPQVLARYNSDSGEIISVGKDGGLFNTELNEGAAYRLGDGSLLVGSTTGLLRVDPLQITEAQSSNGIQLESVKVQYEDDSDLFLLPEQQSVTIRPSFELVTIKLGSSNLITAPAVQFRYQLVFDGNPSTMTELNGETSITLSRMPPGNHSLLVYGEFDGKWQQEPLRLNFRVEQYWWAHQGMQLLFLTVTILMLFITAVNWRNQLRRQRRINQALRQSQHRLQLALQGGGSDIWEWDAKSDSFYVENRQTTLSRTNRPMRIPRLGMTLHRQDLQPVYQAWKQLLAGDLERLNVEFRAISPVGEWRWLWVTGTVIERDPETGQTLLVAGVYADRTKVRKMAHLHTLYAHAMENTTEGMMILDSEYTVTAHNPSALAILGYPKGALEGVSLADTLLTDRTILQEMNLARRWSGEAQMRRRGRGQVPVWLNLSHMSLDSGGDYLVVLFSDISERKKQEMALQKLANFDLVTGLPNRSQFDQQIRELMEQAPGEPLAMLFLDLDRFKHINDTFGHGTGDALLVEVSRLLSSVVGGSGTVCRFGGDEFVIIVRDFSHRLQVEALAERILSLLSEPIQVQQQVLYLSVSIGIALYPEDGSQAEELLKNADLAMYHAKEEGRGRACFYTRERDAQATYQLEMENELRQALEQDKLKIHYQPQLDVSDSSVCGVEALMRWKREDGTPVSPDLFIELAESSGLIIRLDRWMLENACREFMSWPDNQALKLSINVSASHFRQYDYVEFIQSVLQSTGIPPQQLCLEITEGVLMQQVNLAQAHLLALRELGISVAVDDFGTGYSSLSYLSQFAVNSLKIDRSFIQSMLENKANRAITCSILDLGRNLELDVVAEGVETPQQLAFLRSQGCHLVQGYHFARPMPSSQCCQWLANWTPNEQELLMASS
ncbi:EAL domain-containing protein [Ferrimonas sediminicola]|uniref:EAL domain-containing protein n=1 Tax=Ferrimonas sediminicola TaxID=2569538 RepID=A0A4U1BJE8_9GAMM|nr:EAL domain-containing protein [Ferrimonas sediminicola]TKB51295.1 EAL domain-containing protein [Ferrimonas sediminicola]